MIAGVSRETAERLEAYAALLAVWTRKINLIAPSTVPDIATRHVADSAQLWDLAPEGARSWVDLGAGGGLPGLVIAALAAERRQAMRVTLVESDSRKCVFLREAARAMGLEPAILDRRAEAPGAAPHDVVSARALAPLPKLLDLSETWAAPGATAIFPKGAGVETELAEAAAGWRFSVRRARSITDPAATVLALTEIARVDRRL